jgi:hypothetical protein
MRPPLLGERQARRPSMVLPGVPMVPAGRRLVCGWRHRAGGVASRWRHWHVGGGWWRGSPGGVHHRDPWYQLDSPHLEENVAAASVRLNPEQLNT